MMADSSQLLLPLLLFLIFNILVAKQAVRTTLHGGQSRSWSAEQGKENKKRMSGSTPPLPPCCSDGGKNLMARTSKRTKEQMARKGIT